MRRRTFLLALLATACGTGEPQGELKLAAGEEGGIYLDFARLLAANSPEGLRITPIATGGSQDNLDRLRKGEVDLALTLADSATPDLVALGRVYENYLQLVVRADSPVRNLDDLRGQPVSLGAPGSGAAVQGARLDLQARELHMSLDPAVDALQRGEIAALLWSGGVPTPRLAKETNLRLLPLDGVLPRLKAAYGSVYEHVTVRAGVYGSKADVQTVGTANLLMCRRSLPDDLAGAVVRMLVRKAANLVPNQALGTQFLDVRSLIVTPRIDLHPGAAAEYRRLHG
ncbi:C4-dicarboxylate ABC transporter substrate-binding protein [Lentzea sp. NBRC 105346]|uniref:TAXI family TRAP transporter solute-binding subunit n=1 Tax=Lentzea sp. NBRC 105346 TaxID=3032205 RepID=UPI0024A2F014|nr:TAXI family TRAP transporter solute-binding subunit [Lentzea sp. NBRC 105346]GLZ31539.1 C4-dicarboxylate ABC transporter substrate-binding protein [Lentzea sp. NBRC 105346]